MLPARSPSRLSSVSVPEDSEVADGIEAFGQGGVDPGMAVVHGLLEGVRMAGDGVLERPMPALEDGGDGGGLLAERRR